MIGTNKTERELRADGFESMPRWRSGDFYHGVLHENVEHLIQLGVPVFAQTHRRAVTKTELVWVQSWAILLVNEVYPKPASVVLFDFIDGFNLKELARRAVQDAYKSTEPAARAQELINTYLLGGVAALDGALTAGSATVLSVDASASSAGTRRRAVPRSRKRKRLLGE